MAPSLSTRNESRRASVRYGQKVGRTDMPSGSNHDHPEHVPDRSDDWQGARRVLSSVASGVLEQRRHVGERPLGLHLLCLGQPLQGSGVTGQDHRTRRIGATDVNCAIDPGARFVGDPMFGADAGLAVPQHHHGALARPAPLRPEQRCCGQVGDDCQPRWRVRATRDSRASDRPQASPSAPGPSPLPRRARGAPAREAASADRR